VGIATIANPKRESSTWKPLSPFAPCMANTIGSPFATNDPVIPMDGIFPQRSTTITAQPLTKHPVFYIGDGSIIIQVSDPLSLLGPVANLIIKVENTLFNLHLTLLAGTAEAWEGLRELKTHDEKQSVEATSNGKIPKVLDGDSDSQPVKLHVGIKTSQFESFCYWLYPRMATR
jgi:hypothetical protein